METFKTPSEYSVDFNRGFQGFSMANLEKGQDSDKIFWKKLRVIGSFYTITNWLSIRSAFRDILTFVDSDTLVYIEVC